MDDDAREEIGREERPEEHHLGGDEEIDAEEARVYARAAVGCGRMPVVVACVGVGVGRGGHREAAGEAA